MTGSSQLSIKADLLCTTGISLHNHQVTWTLTRDPHVDVRWLECYVGAIYAATTSQSCFIDVDTSLITSPTSLKRIDIMLDMPLKRADAPKSRRRLSTPALIVVILFMLIIIDDR